MSAAFDQLGARLGTLLETIRSCYSLGYTPSDMRAERKFRQIRVKLRRKIVEESTGKEIKPAIIARSGYYRAGRKPDMREKRSQVVSLPAVFHGRVEYQMAQALFVAKELEGFRTSITTSVSPAAHGKGLVAVTLRIDPAGLTLTKADSRYAANFKLIAAVFNETGMMVTNHAEDFRLSLDEAQYREFLRNGSNKSMNLTLPPGEYELRTVLRHIESGKMSTRHAFLEVRSRPKETPRIDGAELTRGYSQVP